MSRALVVVEGEAEETFVNEVLAPHLYSRDYTSVSARIMGNARQRDRRGGIRGWLSVRKDIIKYLKEDTGRLTTTMVDYYGLPQTGQRAWPGRAKAGKLPFPNKAATVQAAILAEISQNMIDASWRFIPYVSMHEYEALLFSDCRKFGEGIGCPELAAELQAIRIVDPTFRPAG